MQDILDEPVWPDSAKFGEILDRAFIGKGWPAGYGLCMAEEDHARFLKRLRLQSAPEWPETLMRAAAELVDEWTQENRIHDATKIRLKGELAGTGMCYKRGHLHELGYDVLVGDDRNDRDRCILIKGLAREDIHFTGRDERGCELESWLIEDGKEDANVLIGIHTTRLNPDCVLPWSKE